MSTAPVLTDEVETEVTAPVLTEEIRAGMLDLFKRVMKEEQTSRRSEVRNTWRQRAFRNGIQHLWYDAASYVYLMPEASGRDLPRYMDVYNIYTPHWRSFVSLLSQNPPGINFVPDDLQQSNDVTAAAYAEKMRNKVDKLVHMKDRQMEAAGYFCTDGRTLTWTRMDANGKLKVTIHGVLESKVPIYARKMERWSYCVLSEEVDLYEAKSEYPEFAPEIESQSEGTAESNYEKYARLNIIANRKGGGYADSLKSVTTEHNAWIRPSRYSKASEDTEEYLEATFPDGVRMTIVGGVLVDAIPEAMEDALRAEWPAPGQGQNRPSMLHDLVPIQEAFNDYKNNQRESADYINPATWVDGDSVDSEALPEQRSEPGAIHIITPKNGKTVDQSVFQETSNGMSPDLEAACGTLLQLGEFTTGDLPALYGQGTADQETASGQKMLSDQAKGQLSMAWAAMQWLFAGTYEIAVRLVAKTSSGPVSVGSDAINPEAILDGQWGCYPDTDSSFPETMADKRASLTMVLTQLGAADPTLVLHPDNQKLVKQYSGLSDLVILAANSRDKQLREIEQLLQEPPIPDEAKMPQWIQQAQQAAIAGQQPAPPPMTTSVPVDPVWDYHQYELDKVQEWLSSDARLEEERKGNLSGLENVKLHGQAHKDALAKIAAATTQQQPMTISGAFKDLDPSTKVQVLERDGYQPDQTAFETDAVQSQQDKAATTQHKAAQAQHQSVLAAKEAVAPVKTIPSPQAPPEKK